MGNDVEYHIVPRQYRGTRQLNDNKPKYWTGYTYSIIPTFNILTGRRGLSIPRQWLGVDSNEMPPMMWREKEPNNNDINEVSWCVNGGLGVIPTSGLNDAPCDTRFPSMICEYVL